MTRTIVSSTTASTTAVTIINEDISSDPEAHLIVHREPSFAECINAAIYTNLYFNIVLTVAVPLGILAGILKWNATSVFLINLVGIICLAKMLDLATDQLSERLGQGIGALINASFGNAVELIVGVIALKEGLLVVVQSSLIGSILSNLLLVTGFCFLLGGIKYKTQKFNSTTAGTGSTIFILSLFGFMLPAVLNYIYFRSFL